MPTSTTEYIPYSERNGIKDPRLGGLLNYLERLLTKHFYNANPSFLK